MLICNGPEKREWYVPNGDLRNKLWPELRPGTGSIAYSLLNGHGKSFRRVDVGAGEWVNDRNAHNYWVREDSRPALKWDRFDTPLVEDETQLIDIDNAIEEQGSWRSDFRRE